MTKTKKPAESAESPMARLKQQPLWFWGVMCICGGIGASVIAPLIMEPPVGAAAQRGAALGRAVASGLFIVIGIGLMIAGLIRRK